MNAFTRNEPSRPWSLFRLFRRASDEVTHSYMLAYLLDPKLPHGLGSSFLEAFLRHLGCCRPFNVSNVGVDTEVSCGRVRADIVVDLGDAAIIIENKLYAEEGPEQTFAQEQAFQSDSRYRSKELTFVFLTPKGQAAQNAAAFVSCSWLGLSQVIAETAFSRRRGLSLETFIFLQEFAEHVERDICMRNQQWGEIPDISRLYLQFASEIGEVSRAFAQTVEDIQDGWCGLADQLMPPPHWKPRFPNSKPRPYVQVYKPTWHSKTEGYFVHFELDSSVELLSSRKVVFMLDVEKPDGTPLLDMCRLFDQDESIREGLEAIQSEYRLVRKYAIARKVYRLADDLSDVAEVLTRSFQEHAFLEHKVDEVVARWMEKRAPHKPGG